MPSPKKYEQQFLNALRDIFVGAKVEGDSGYINLMQIKSRYYEQGVFPRLQKDINEALKPFPDFREELFDKLYTFFQRYFSESGSIYFRYTALHQNIYEKVYTDDRDVMLFWKTHMLYYVKTDRIFVSLNVEVDEIKFFFDAANMTLKRANEKRQVVYAFRKAETDGTLVFDVGYSEKGKSTKVDDMLKAIKLAGHTITDETLDRAFRVFEKQSEVDYFINKNARTFLQEQFELWMYQYLFAGQNVWKEERLAQLQVLKGIAFNVIDFISQFEDELVKVWNKPKFVRNSHYIITLDHVIARSEATKQPSGLLKKIITHKGMKAQIAEWQSLGMVDSKFKTTLLNEKDVVGEPRHSQYKYLPLDTRYFPDLELDILAFFDDLDTALDGWLIHSENYQALNTVLPKFRGQVKSIYIDPPYNTGTADFTYANKFQHSSWATMIENRLTHAYSFLRQDGILCATIDDYELRNLLLIFDSFIENRLLGTVPIKSKPQGRATARGFSINHEYAIFVAKSDLAEVGRLPRTGSKAERYADEDEDGIFAWTNLRGTGANSTRKDRRKLFYPIYVKNNSIRIPSMIWNSKSTSWDILEQPKENEEIIYPLDPDGQERVWSIGWERAKDQTSELRVIRGNNGTQITRKYRPNYEGALPGTWWDDSRYSASESGTRLLQNIFGQKNDQSDFSFPKSIHAVVDCLQSSGIRQDQNGLVLDFFGGSGTTAHAVMNLNRVDDGKRKYIIVEMGEHFNTVILPRIKKIAFNSKWKDGKPVFEKGESGMSHFVKYYELEGYEDALRRTRYADADLFNNPYEDPYNQYVFMRDSKMLDSLELDYKKNAVHFHPEKVYKDIDLAETLSNLRGKWIKRITADEVEFQDGERIHLKDLDWHLIKPLVWWQ